MRRCGTSWGSYQPVQVAAVRLVTLGGKEAVAVLTAHCDCRRHCCARVRRVGGLRTARSDDTSRHGGAGPCSTAAARRSVCCPKRRRSLRPSGSRTSAAETSARPRSAHERARPPRGPPPPRAIRGGATPPLVTAPACCDTKRSAAHVAAPRHGEWPSGTHAAYAYDDELNKLQIMMMMNQT